MNKFQHGLRDEALTTLQALASAPEDNWWKELLRLWTPSGRGDGLRLAIRDNTIDLYRHGNRVAHVGFGQCKKGEPAAGACRNTRQIFTGADAGDRMLKLNFKDGGWAWSDGSPDVSFDQIIANIDARMAALRGGKFSRKGLEKEGVDAIAGANATVIDLEMGLPRDPALSPEDGGAPELIWWRSNVPAMKFALCSGKPRPWTIPGCASMMKPSRLKSSRN